MVKVEARLVLIRSVSQLSKREKGEPRREINKVVSCMYVWALFLLNILLQEEPLDSLNKREEEMDYSSTLR